MMAAKKQTTATKVKRTVKKAVKAAGSALGLTGKKKSTAKKSTAKRSGKGK